MKARNAFNTVLVLLFFSTGLICSNAKAAKLTSSSGGTFTMSLDRNALAAYYGYQLASFWDSDASAPSNPSNTGDYFVSYINTTEISAINQSFELTAVGVSTPNQPSQRSVRASSADFSIDSESLTGLPGAELGMAGVQGFWVPYWQKSPTAPITPAGLVNGDFSLVYSNPQDREAVWNGFGLAGKSTGWHLNNNMYFTMPVYDLSNLSVAMNDVFNWQFSGDLLMSAENGFMLKGAQLNKVGSFCLGVGSYANCNPAPVPLPSTALLFSSTLLSLIGYNRRKSRRIVRFVTLR